MKFWNQAMARLSLNFMREKLGFKSEGQSGDTGDSVKSCEIDVLPKNSSKHVPARKRVTILTVLRLSTPFEVFLQIIGVSMAVVAGKASTY
jgi:hypothetical protein